ncbi:Uncharacterised protein [Vibrio cholerae]|nr:Uncharacterised protein [Vibrio cholerae]CSB34476.1 Uncharacterised protein [Vibrio cholerae]
MFQFAMCATASSQRYWNCPCAPNSFTVSSPAKLSMRLAYFCEASLEPSSIARFKRL